MIVRIWGRCWLTEEVRFSDMDGLLVLKKTEEASVWARARIRPGSYSRYCVSSINVLTLSTACARCSSTISETSSRTVRGLS